MRGADDPFNALAEALCWAPAAVVLILTGYFDESGHPARSRLFGVGGVVATRPLWNAVGREWRALLKSESIHEIHMLALATCAGEFADKKKWSVERKNKLVGRAIGIIKEYLFDPGANAVFLGNTHDGLHQRRPRPTLEALYVDSFKTIAQRLAFGPFTGDDKINLVFATHDEIPEERLARYLATWLSVWKSSPRAKARMGTFSTGSPREIVQLQVADVVAFVSAEQFRTDTGFGSFWSDLFGGRSFLVSQ